MAKDKEKLQQLEDAQITLENYCDRYIPLVMMQQIKDLIKPVLDSDQLKTFNKVAQRCHHKISS
jgi:hypothetical protein